MDIPKTRPRYRPKNYRAPLVMKSKLTKVFSRYREIALLPIGAAAVYLGAKFIRFMTGRPPVDGASQIEGIAARLLGLAVAVALTGFVQEHFFGYRSKGGDAKVALTDDIHDSCVTAFLLLLFVWALWH